jgi:rhomboid protease GluP
METVSYAGYREMIAMEGLSNADFLEAAQEAALQLNWFIVGRDERRLICQTAVSDVSQGEWVVIGLTEDGTAVLECVPVNEYFWEEAQLRAHAATFGELLQQTITEQHKTVRSRNPVYREKYGALAFSKTYFATPLLAYSCALIFIIMVLAGISPIDPKAASLLAWGGNSGEEVASGQWWRLITYMFLHAGGMHLLTNSFALFYIGLYLEPFLGKARFLATYLLTGVCAGLASILMHSYSVGVGASGAIFGMYGAFFALLTTDYFQKTARTTMLRSILFFIVFNLLSGMQGNVDNAAHIGGLVSGIFVGFAYFPGIRDQAPASRQVAVTLKMTGIVLAIAAVVITWLHFHLA